MCLKQKFVHNLNNLQNFAVAIVECVCVCLCYVHVQAEWCNVSAIDTFADNSRAAKADVSFI